MAQKRPRSVNWDEEEKQLFRSICMDFYKIIENKSLHTDAINLKTNTWLKIHKKFNELNVRPRDLKQLRIQWKVMKNNLKKKRTSVKKDYNYMGSETTPLTSNQSDEVEMEMNNYINPADVVEVLPDHSAYDTQFSQDEPAKSPLDIKIVSIPVKASDDVPTTSMENRSLNPAEKDRTDYSHEMLVYSKMLKDDEHIRQMEMVEEEHAIKMAIHREKLKSAKLEREILELKKHQLLRNNSVPH